MLHGLLGRPLGALIYRGWDTDLYVDDDVVQFSPQAEMGDGKEFVRLSVRSGIAPRPTRSHDRIVCQNLGSIAAVVLLDVAVGFSPPKDVPSIMVGDVEIPAGAGYVPVFLAPHASCLEEHSAGLFRSGGTHLFRAEVGVTLVSDEDRATTIYVDGAGYFTHAVLGVELDRLPTEAIGRTILTA